MAKAPGLQAPDGSYYVTLTDGSGNILTTSQPPRRALLFGDSITLNCGSISGTNPTIYKFGAGGYFTVMNALMGQPFFLDPTLIFGVNGDTTAGLLTRFAASVTANASKFDIAFVQSGINDANLGTTGAVIAANLESVCTQILAMGKVCVLYTIFPSNILTATKYSQLMEANSRLRIWALSLAKNPNFILVDAFRDLVDPTSSTGAIVTAYQPDGFHPSPAGCYLIAKRAAESMTSIVQPLNTSLTTPADTYDATNNKAGNALTNSGMLTLSGGTVTNGSGVVVNGYTIQKVGAGTWINSEVVASTETNISTFDASAGYKQVLTFNIASGRTTAEEIQLQANFQTGLYTTGDVIYGECKLELINPVNLYEASLSILDYTAAFATLQNQAFDGGGIGNTSRYYPGSYTQILRTPRITLNATSALQGLSLFFWFDCSGTTGGSAIAKVSEVKLVKVV